MRYDQTEPKQFPDAGVASGKARRLDEGLGRMGKESDAGLQPANQNKNNAREQEDTIDLVELFFFLLSKLHFIVVGMVLGGVLMGMYASVQVPVYSATSKLYIMGQTGLNIMTDLQIGATLTKDYQEVFDTWEIHQMVNEQLGESYTYSQLRQMLTVTNPKDTRVLYITVKHTDPQKAADLANAYATASKQFITDVMDTDEPSTLSLALVPVVGDVASVTKSVMIGILAGTFAVCAVLVVIFLLDDRPKSPEDIMRCANIPTLAVIPANPELMDWKYYKKKVGEK